MKNIELIEWLKQANPLADVYFERDVTGPGRSWLPVESISTVHFGEQGSIILSSYKIKE